MNDEPVKFGEALKKLENIVEKLEDPKMDLDEAVELLEEGLKLHKVCKDKLSSAEARIKILLKDGKEEVETISDVIAEDDIKPPIGIA